jgi:transcriptional regulator with XRE-family HTH domain
MPGIKDVAEQAGLSIATVSRALSGKGNVSPRSRERARAAASAMPESLMRMVEAPGSAPPIPTIGRWMASS